MAYHSQQFWSILFGNWYRCPNLVEIESIASLHNELDMWRKRTIETIIVGDLNCHNLSSLSFSSHSSAEGTFLSNICQNNGLKQLVKSPTRGSYLLDLVLSDLSVNSHVEVFSRQISDHSSVFATFSLPLEKSIRNERLVWEYEKTNWLGLRVFFSEVDWSFLDFSTPDSGTRRLREFFFSAMEFFIPRKLVSVWKMHIPG